MREKKNTFKRMRRRILAALLVAGLVSSGTSAFAAGTAQLTETVPLQRYQADPGGFSPIGDPDVIHTVMDNTGTVCYSLTDLARATGNDPSGWQWGFSAIYFHGSLEEPRYDIPAYRMVIDGRNCEYCDETLAVQNGLGYSIKDPGSVAFLEKDGEVYCSAVGVEALFPAARVMEGEIRILVPGEGEGIRFLTRSRLPQENEAAFTRALWSLYNDYPEGYQLVMKRAARIRIVRYSAARSAMGADRIAAYVTSGSRTIRFVEEALDRTSNEYLAAELVHECTHLEEYAALGHTSETAPTVATAKTLYALEIPASEIRDQLNSAPRRYAQGVIQALDWLSTVTGSLDR